MDAREQALQQALVREDHQPLLSLTELADRSGISLPVLEILAREGLLVPRVTEPEPRYQAGDADAVAAGLEMVSVGLPIGELLEVARLADEAMRPVAEAAVDTFARFVSDPVEGSAATTDEAAARLVAAFETILPAAGRLVAHHFERLLVDTARRRLAE